MHESFSVIASGGDRTPAALFATSLLAVAVPFVLRKRRPKAQASPGIEGHATSKARAVLPPAFIDELWRIS